VTRNANSSNPSKSRRDLPAGEHLPDRPNVDPVLPGLGQVLGEQHIQVVDFVEVA
jgi:hypothetical protein